MEDLLRAGIPLTVFPEGGTSRGETVRPFLSSILEPAARLNVPCYAASLSYDTPGNASPPSHTVCWSGGNPPFFRHLLGVLELRRIEVRVTFSDEPIQSQDRKELARRLEDEVRRTFAPVRQELAAAGQRLEAVIP
jgi:1-acyl-sn-glycerol-3-phosphate acyltransferase